MSNEVKFWGALLDYFNSHSVVSDGVCHSITKIYL